MELIASTQQVARKEYNCDGWSQVLSFLSMKEVEELNIPVCSGRIKKGQVYKRSVIKDGEVYSRKSCLSCIDAISKHKLYDELYT